MIDMLIQIPSSIFLIEFIIFSVVCIWIAWFWNNNGGVSTHLPSLTSLSPFEMAALRDGCKGVIQIALFNLWHRNLLITTSSVGKKTQIQKNDALTLQSESQIEEILYQFATQPRAPADFFKDDFLQARLDRQIKPINQKLEKKHLKRTGSQKRQIWTAFWMTLLLILGLGSTKLYFDLLYDRPVGFLILLLIALPIITWFILKPANRNTSLGYRYQKKLAEHFEWTKYNDNNGIEPDFLVAIFGVSVLTHFATFSVFEQTFSDDAVNNTRTTSSGGGCGGSDGDGGGCGGCG
ncbi:TIGR04222 domain-containing membrane protein [Candidatus Parabeggiatoa sp. HSG14]|uniref:TIGR04222 domain-containing membrane protein n=1 Tax=Candidatus Parabeggiatoa sp. HSG14 TaxID=3055593 RepID=UPI0025A7CBB9|nr:TIGR04222 domain-containing membrane protein [Thiotrichales bacterium HSG14]